VLEAAGMAPSHEQGDRAPAGEVLHEPGVLNPGGGGLRSALGGGELVPLPTNPSISNAVFINSQVPNNITPD
jgi:hypothetical protein